MFNKNIVIIFLILSGTLSALAIAEISLQIVRGDPRTRLFADPRVYFNYEPYRTVFRKAKNAQGSTGYFPQRTGLCNPEPFTLRKPPSLRRIVIIGESTAGTFARSKEELRTALRQRLPSLDFEVLNCSMGAYDSSRIVPIAEEVVNYDPDLLLVFMGNNLWDEAFRKNWLLSRPSFRYIYERSWIVRELFARFQRDVWDWKPGGDRNAYFRNNYESIVTLAGSRGIPVVLYRMPANLRDFPPGIGMGEFLSKDRMLVRMAMERGDHRKALALLRAMKGNGAYASDAYLYFMMGKAYEKLKDPAAAREAYLASVTLDADPGLRCDPVRNDIIETLAKKYDCPVVAIDRLFYSLVPGGIAGNDIFFDYCHWDVPLNDVIIRETVRRIEEYNETHERPILAERSLWEQGPRAADTDYSGKKLRDRIFFGGQHYTRHAYYKAIDEAIRGDVERSVYFFQRIYQLAPGMLERYDERFERALFEFVHRGYGFPEIDHATAWPRVWACKGEMYRRNGEYAKALACFQRSITEEPGQTMAYVLEGLTYRAMKDENRARAAWKKAASQDDGFKWLLETGGKLISSGG